MAQPTKAILLDIRAFLAENNIRRSTSAFSINYGSESGDVIVQSLLLKPNDPKTLVSPMDKTVVTLLRTLAPITVEITKRDGSTFTVQVSKLLALDCDVSQIKLTNTSLEPVKVSIHQG